VRLDFLLHWLAEDELRHASDSTLAIDEAHDETGNKHLSKENEETGEDVDERLIGGGAEDAKEGGSDVHYPSKESNAQIHRHLDIGNYEDMKCLHR